MDDFLYYLAKQKYLRYKHLYINNSCVHREEECIDRIKQIHKYEMILEVIAMLSIDNQIDLKEIEKKCFGDAPYVF